MAQIKEEDIINGSTLTVDADGTSHIRAFLVEGLDGNGDGRLFQASKLVPQRGALHPTIPFLQVDSISVSPIDMTLARVIVTYKFLGAEEQEPEETQPPVVRIGGSTQTVRTKEAFGLANAISLDGSQPKIKMEVEFIKTPDEEIGVELAGNPEIFLIGEAEIQIPQMVISLSRKEKNPTTEKAKKFLGSVNSTAILGDAARFWMCSRLDSETTDGGESYDVNYEFIRAVGTNQAGAIAPGWDQKITWFDVVTGETPPEVFEQVGTAIKDFQVARAEEFRELELGIEDLI